MNQKNDYSQVKASSGSSSKQFGQESKNQLKHAGDYGIKEHKNKVLLGRSAEKLVKEYYLKRGYTFIAENFEYFVDKERGRHGEIDLIFCKKQPVKAPNTNLIQANPVFASSDLEKIFLVEVKSRSQHSQKIFGPTIGQITKTKIQLIKTTYQHFLRKNPEYLNRYCEIQVAIVDLDTLSIEIFRVLE